MKEIRRSARLANVSYAVRGPLVAAADELIAQGVDVLKLNIGNPAAFGYSTSHSVIEAMSRRLDGAQAYSHSRGLPEAREAALGYCRSKGIKDITVNDVYIGNGASELIAICLNALMADGDEILIPSPDYPLWTASANFTGGKAVHYRCDESSDWMPDLADIESKITDRTRAITIINPNNPTGALYSEDMLLRIADIARRHGLIVFCDEIYDRLLMPGEKHTSLASLVDDLLVITFNGLSKSHQICGFRSGWMCISGDRSGAADYIAGINVLLSMRLCPNVPAQFALIEALKDPFECKLQFMPGGRTYEQIVTTAETINSIPGMSVKQARGAFYMFPRIDAKRFNITDDNKFCMDFLKEKHVLVVAGTGFNWPDPDHFRVVCLPEVAVLKEAMERLGDFLQTYRQ